MVIHIWYTLAHVVIYVRRTQILVSLLCPLCMAITLRLCLVKITCEFCYIKRIIRWGLGTTKCEWVLVTSYVDVRSILCCVVIAILVVLDFVELSVKKMRRKKRERKYFVKHQKYFRRSTANLFFHQSIPYLTRRRLLLGRSSFMVQNSSFGGSCVVVWCVAVVVVVVIACIV